MLVRSYAASYGHNAGTAATPAELPHANKRPGVVSTKRKKSWQENYLKPFKKASAAGKTSSTAAADDADATSLDQSGTGMALPTPTPRCCSNCRKPGHTKTTCVDL